ncbi:glycosyltransferase family 4 protein [Pontibacter korlensis]
MFYDDKLINILMHEEKPSGGAAVQAYGWIRGLSEAGQDVHIITTPNPNGILKEECKELKIVPLYDKQKGIRWIRWVYYRLPYIYNKIKLTKPDYLYQGIPGWTSFFIGMICHQLNIKYVLRISNDFLLDDRILLNYSKAHRFFQKLGLKLSYCILCQNEYQLGVIQKELPHKKTIKLANPIFLKATEAPVEPEKRNYIAWLGLYQYQKNLKLLYEIATSLPNEQFFVAGKESSKCDDETKLYLRKLEKLQNVKFVGFLSREQVLPFLSKAKFLLNTSHYEGFSNTFLEAMSTGTPILSSHKVNPDSIISKYKLGLVYEDAESLQNQLSKITPDTYKEMSSNVLAYVKENHEYKTLANKLLSFLELN